MDRTPTPPCPSLAIALALGLALGLTSCGGVEADSPQESPLLETEPRTPPPVTGEEANRWLADFPQEELPDQEGKTRLRPGAVQRIVEAQAPASPPEHSTETPVAESREEAPVSPPTASRADGGATQWADRAIKDDSTTAPLGPLRILRAAVAAEIADREPKGVAERFPEGQEVYCHTVLGNPKGFRRTIRHNWYAGNERKASVELHIKAERWRTWSHIPVYGRGPWRVEVVDEDGEVLTSLPFVVE